MAKQSEYGSFKALDAGNHDVKVREIVAATDTEHRISVLITEHSFVIYIGVLAYFLGGYTSQSERKESTMSQKIFITGSVSLQLLGLATPCKTELTQIRQTALAL